MGRLIPLFPFLIYPSRRISVRQRAQGAGAFRSGDLLCANSYLGVAKGAIKVAAIGWEQRRSDPLSASCSLLEGVKPRTVRSSGTARLVLRAPLRPTSGRPDLCSTVLNQSATQRETLRNNDN